MKFTPHDAIPFVAKAKRRGGVSMAEAVAQAETALVALAPALKLRVLRSADELQARIIAASQGHAPALASARREADLLAGCAAHAGLANLGHAAASLCRLIDTSHPRTPSRETLMPFADAVALLAHSGDAPEAAKLLAGLRTMVEWEATHASATHAERDGSGGGYVGTRAG